MPGDIALLTELKELRLAGFRRSTNVLDITPLQNLTALRTLILDNTQVADITPLQNLAALQNLDLNNTRVADLRPLTYLSKIEQLRFSNTPATATSPDLKRLSEIDNIEERTKQTLAYLRTLPPYPEPLPWESPSSSRQNGRSAQTSVVLTAQIQINFILEHAASTKVTASTTAEQIRFALRDVPAEPGSNCLPDVLQSALDTATVLDRLSNAEISEQDQNAEDTLRSRIAELEQVVEKLTLDLADATKAREAAEAKARTGGVWAHYKSATGKTMGVGQFALAGTGIPATVLWMLGPNHPLVQTLLKLLQ